MFSWGSENIYKDKRKNIKTSYSAYAALAQSFQAESAKIPSTLRRRCRQQFAFSIPWCNCRVCNLGDLSPTRTSRHEVDNVPYLAVAAFGKGCQTVSEHRKSLFGLTN
jgi:hypothetical protein